MLAKLRPRSVYDILAAIGCFAALTTGVAYAANTIGSADVINDSLLSEDVKNGTLRAVDVTPNTIGSSRVADDSLTGADIKGLGERTGGATPATNNTDDCFIGEIALTASQRLQSGYLPANGQELPISENENLFQVIGTTYGGDGEETFRLPDLRSLAPDDMTYGVCAFGIYPS